MCIFFRMSRFLSILDTIDIICLVNSNVVMFKVHNCICSQIINTRFVYQFEKKQYIYIYILKVNNTHSNEIIVNEIIVYHDINN